MTIERLDIPIDLDLSAALASLGRLKGSINASVANAAAFEATFSSVNRLAESAQDALTRGVTQIRLQSGELVTTAELHQQLLHQSQQLAVKYEQHRDSLSASVTTLNIQLVSMRELNRTADRLTDSHKAIEHSARQARIEMQQTASVTVMPPNSASGGQEPPSVGAGMLMKVAAGGTAALTVFSKVKAGLGSVNTAVRGVTATLDQFNIGRLAAKADPALNLIRNLFTNFGSTVAKMIDWVTTHIDSMATHWTDSAQSGVGALGEINGALDRLFKMIVKHVVAIRERVQASMNAEGTLIPGLERAVKIQEALFQQMWQIFDRGLLALEKRLAGSPLAGLMSQLNAALRVGDGGGLTRVADVVEGVSSKVLSATESFGKLEANVAGVVAVTTGKFPKTSGVVADYASAVQAAVRPAKALNNVLQVETSLVHGVNAALALVRRGYVAVTGGMASWKKRNEQLNRILENTPESYRKWAKGLDVASMVMRPFIVLVNVMLVAVKKLAGAVAALLAPLTALGKLKGVVGGLFGFGKAAGSAAARTADLTSGSMYLASGLMGVATAGKVAERSTTNIFLGGARGLKSFVRNLLSSKLVIGGLVASAVMWGRTNAIATETANVKFGTLLRSMEQGVALNAELVSFSAVTPYSVGSLREGAGLLLASKVAARDVTGELKMIGDISSGVSKPIEEFAQIYQKMATAPKVDLGMLQQLAERGVPIYDELQKIVGGTREEMFSMISSGELGFGSVRQAMQAMTAQGGMFYNSMQAQSETYAGLWSTFKDNVGIALEQVGGILVETGKDTLTIGISLVQSVTSALAVIRPALTGWMEFTQTIARTVWRAFMSVFSAVGGFIRQVFGTQPGGPSFLQSVVEWSVIASTALTYMAANWDKAMTIAIVGSLLKLEQLRSWFTNFAFNTLPTVVEVVSGWIMQAASAVVSVLPAIGSALMSFVQALPGMFVATVNGLVSVVTGGIGLVISAVTTGITYLPTIAATTVKVLWSVLTTLPQMVWSAVSTALSFVVGLFSGGVQVVSGFSESIGHGLLAILNVVGTAIVSSLSYIFDGLGSLVGFFYTTVPELLSYFWNNWSTVFANAGTFLWETMVSAVTKITDMISSLWEWIKTGGQSAMTSLAETSAAVAESVTSGLDKIAAGPSRSISDFERRMQDTMAEVSAGFGNGMGEAINAELAKLTPKQVDLLGNTGPDMSTPDMSPQTSSASSAPVTLRRDSAETLRAIFGAQNRDKAPEKQLAETKKTNQILSKLATKIGGPQVALEAF